MVRLAGWGRVNSVLSFFVVTLAIWLEPVLALVCVVLYNWLKPLLAQASSV